MTGIKRIKYGFLRLLSDVLSVFYPRKLFIYSWMRFEGAKLLHNNWGDDINKFFFESISHLKVMDVTTSRIYRLLPIKAYSCIGSILGNFTSKRYEVWGSGIIKEDMPLPSIPRIVHSVRGPLTRKELLKKGVDCPEIYGDPALLVSRYYRKFVDKQYKWGIIPHYSDENNPIFKEFCRKHPEILIIKMKDYLRWTDIPDQIMKCERIISSSLHGLIIADSYGVCNSWVCFSNNIVGSNFKYLDYFQSVGREISAPYRINNLQDLDNIILFDKTSRAYNIDYRKIFESCPFRDKLIDYQSLIPQIPHYRLWKDKEKNYCKNIYIRSNDEFDSFMKEMEEREGDYYYRGVSDASYKMYSSSQRHWLQMSDRVLNLGTTNYYQSVLTQIKQCKEKAIICQYLQNQKVLDNDMYVFALMLHFGAPSPMIAFSQRLRIGLCFAIDGLSEWSEKGIDSLEDFISLYYISKKSVYIISPEEITGAAGCTDFLFSPINNQPGDTQADESASSLEYTCGYMFPDDHILGQEGFFMLNNTQDQPLAEMVNKRSCSTPFYCVNIRKNLVSHIVEKHLKPYNISHSSIYCLYDNGVAKIQKAMDTI